MATAAQRTYSTPFGEMTRAQLAKRIQYTLVAPDATREDIIRHLEQCVAYDVDAAMIGPCWVPLARDVLRGTGVKVATAVAFPMGNDSVWSKVAQVRDVLAMGADEIDFMPNIGFLLGGMEDAYRDEMTQIVRAAEGHVVKAMLEFGLLPSTETKRAAARLAEEAGVHWVKQSSGWGKGGIPATAEDVRLLRETVTRTRVKASGQVNSVARALEMFNAGAELLGTSSAHRILDDKA
jgi:deoxyribose-phosphate aldolase